VEAGANTEARTQGGCTPLLVASNHPGYLKKEEEHNMLCAIRELASLGADTEARNIFNRTCLLEAIDSGNFEAVPVLLECGASTMVKAVGKEAVEQPLHCALRMGWLATIKILVEYGADTGARTGEFASPLDYFLDQRKYHLDEWKYLFDHFAQMGRDFPCLSYTGRIDDFWPAMMDAFTDKGVEEVMRLLRPRTSP